MIRILAALVGLFILSCVPAKAQSSYFTIPQDLVQQAISERLPFTARSGKWFEFIFQPESKLNFNADGTVTLHGTVQAVFLQKIFYTGTFDATTNLQYNRTEEAFFLSRPSLDNLEGDFTPNTERTGLVGKATQGMKDNLSKLVNSQGFRPVFDLFGQKLEEKPIFKLKQDDRIHRAMASTLNQPDVQLLVRDKILTICKAEACNNL